MQRVISYPKMLFSFLAAGAAKDMAVDGTTPVLYKYTAAVDCYVERVLFLLIDGGVQPADFGGIPGGLTNGLEVGVYDGGDNLVKDFLDGITVKTNADFALLAGVDTTLDTGAGDDSVSVRWTISKSGSPLWLQVGDAIGVKIQDDLTDLVSFRAVAQGTLA